MYHNRHRSSDGDDAMASHRIVIVDDGGNASPHPIDGDVVVLVQC